VIVVALRKAPEPSSGRSELPPAELFDDHVVTRMQAFHDASETVPDWWSQREPTSYYGTRAEQEGRWREASAFRRLKDAQREWLIGHGYEGRQGHMDWGRFNRDYNRPAYYGGPRPSTSKRSEG